MPRTRTLSLAGAAALALAIVGWAALGQGIAAGAGSSLVKGWNNVGYMGDQLPPSEALTSIDGDYDVIYRWNSITDDFEVFGPDAPSFANSIDTVRPGDALWVNVTAESATLDSTSSGATAGGAGVVSVAASTFMPSSDLAIYEKTYNELHPVGTDAESQRYYAPVSIPNGAQITSMTAAYSASGGTVQVRLDYTPITNGTDAAKVYKLAEVLSSGGASPQTDEAFAHTADNAANVYFLIVDLTGGAGTKLNGVSIAYQ